MLTISYFLDIISPSGVITNIVNPTGAGAAGGTVNIQVRDLNVCNAQYPQATTALNNVGSYSGIMRSATAFPAAASGVWQLRVRNIYTFEPAFLTNATLNFLTTPAISSFNLTAAQITNITNPVTTGAVVQIKNVSIRRRKR